MSEKNKYRTFRELRIGQVVDGGPLSDYDTGTVRIEALGEDWAVARSVDGSMRGTNKLCYPVYLIDPDDLPLTDPEDDE